MIGPEKRSEAEPQDAEGPEEPSILAQYKDLYEKNNDIAGWLSKSVSQY